MSKPKGFKIAVALTTVIQASVSVVVPTALCIFAAKYLTEHLGWPPVTMVFAIVLGVASGFFSMFKYISSASRATHRDDED